MNGEAVFAGRADDVVLLPISVDVASLRDARAKVVVGEALRERQERRPRLSGDDVEAVPDARARSDQQVPDAVARHVLHAGQGERVAEGGRVPEDLAELRSRAPVDQQDTTADRRVEVEVLAIGDGQEIRKTVSIGIATVPGGERETKARLIKKADYALYEAKETGRNKVVQWSEELLRKLQERRRTSST